MPNKEDIIERFEHNKNNSKMSQVEEGYNYSKHRTNILVSMTKHLNGLEPKRSKTAQQGLDIINSLPENMQRDIEIYHTGNINVLKIHMENALERPDEFGFSEKDCNLVLNNMKKIAAWNESHNEHENWVGITDAFHRFKVNLPKH